jgi:hypothetical protein
MNENQNKAWTPKEDALLITSRHRGIDYQLNLLGRSRKAIKTRLSLLEKNGTIDDTYILTSDDYWESKELREKYVGVIEWCQYVVDNYNLSTDDIKLLSLVFDCKK